MRPPKGGTVPCRWALDISELSRINPVVVERIGYLADFRNREDSRRCRLPGCQDPYYGAGSVHSTRAGMGDKLFVHEMSHLGLNGLRQCWCCKRMYQQGRQWGRHVYRGGGTVCERKLQTAEGSEQVRGIPPGPGQACPVGADGLLLLPLVGAYASGAGAREEVQLPDEELPVPVEAVETAAVVEEPASGAESTATGGYQPSTSPISSAASPVQPVSSASKSVPGESAREHAELLQLMKEHLGEGALPSAPGSASPSPAPQQEDSRSSGTSAAVAGSSSVGAPGSHADLLPAHVDTGINFAPQEASSPRPGTSGGASGSAEAGPAEGSASLSESMDLGDLLRSSQLVLEGGASWSISSVLDTEEPPPRKRRRVEVEVSPQEEEQVLVPRSFALLAWSVAGLLSRYAYLDAIHGFSKQ